MMVAIKNIILLCIAVLFSALCFGSPKTVYIDNVNGNNKNTGLERGQAYRDIKYGLKKMQPGDELFLISNGPSQPYREKFIITLSSVSGKHSTISGDPEQGGSYIVGLKDLSASSDGFKWLLSPDGSWYLPEATALYGLWFSSESQWKDRGINGLKELSRSASKKNIKEGEWFYDSGSRRLIYRPVAGQLLESLHFEGVVNNKNFTISGSNNLTVQHLNIAFAGKTSVLVTGNSNTLNFRDFSLRHASNNGILFSDGSDFKVERCSLSHIGNSGIKFRGSQTHKISNTLVRDCKISNIKGNSALTYHKSADYLDIGDNHRIENNILHNCGEEGIDITSGADFFVTNNTTYDNLQASFVVGHNAKDIVVNNHLSAYDGRQKGAVKINYSHNVKLQNSLVYSGLRHQVLLHGNDGFSAEGNWFIAGKESAGPLIKVETSSRNNLFNRNYFSNGLQVKSSPLLLMDVELVSDKINGRKVGVPVLAEDDNLGAEFQHNLWSVKDKKAKAFYNSRRSSSYYNFSEAKGFLSKDSLTSSTAIGKKGDAFYLSPKDRLKLGSSLPNVSMRWKQIEAEISALK